APGDQPIGSGDRARDLSSIPGTWVRPAPDGRSEPPRHPVQSPGRKERQTIGWEPVLPWCALFTAFKSHLHWRDPSQGASPSRPAPTDRGPRIMGRNAAAAAKPRCSASTTSKEISPKSAHGQDIRRKRPEPDAKSRGKGRAAISVLRVAQPRQRYEGFRRTLLAIACGRDRTDLRHCCLPVLELPNR